MITVTDTQTDQTVTVASADEVVAAIRPWFPNPTHEMRHNLQILDSELRRHEYTGESDAYFDIKIEHHDA